MPNIKDISKATLNVIGAMADNRKRPVHVGEAMSCWLYQTQLDGVLSYCEIVINQAQDRDVLNTIKRSQKLALLHKKMLDEFMADERISPSDGYTRRPPVDTETIPAGIRPSEKEIVNTIQINATLAFGMTASALSQCLRKDLQMIFFKIMTDVMIFNQEMADLSEKRGWLRIPPAYRGK
ncbi:MAG: DUF3231 family protein [Sporolactobacillus sp.]|nr:DUF3231 family protein [Sporolactobacillus sp.]MCI1882372.1 DUF3231 family protein [Sporolactobacillus sp.]